MTQASRHGNRAHQHSTHRSRQRVSFTRGWVRHLLPVAGLVALLWFLIRVIPKPIRATYPCQRAAFPLASGFVVWVVGMVTSVVAVRRAGAYLRQSRYTVGAVLIAVAVASVWLGKRSPEVFVTSKPTSRSGAKPWRWSCSMPRPAWRYWPPSG